MGNCCGTSSMVWAEDDVVKAEQSSSSTPLKNSVASVGVSIREVKIKMTKKELGELLSRAEMDGLSSQQVLTRLITASDQVSGENDRRHNPNPSWQPSLKTIPEVN